VLDTTAATKQLLVVTERFHSGWRATADGGPREPLRVYGDYLGCVVDPGQHRLAFSFMPASMRYGLRASLVGAALTLAVTLVLAVPRPRAAHLERHDVRI